MKMQEFEWSEVEEYLNNNLEAKFDYYEMGYSEYNKGCMCLMASFFYEKGIDFSNVSLEGFEALSDIKVPVARVINPPIKMIADIHKGETGCPIGIGLGIKYRLEYLKKKQFIAE